MRTRRTGILIQEKNHCLIFEVQKTSMSWGCSSSGRAPALQAGGKEFDPPHLHHYLETKV